MIRTTQEADTVDAERRVDRERVIAYLTAIVDAFPDETAIVSESATVDWVDAGTQLPIA